MRSREEIDKRLEELQKDSVEVAQGIEEAEREHNMNFLEDSIDFSLRLKGAIDILRWVLEKE